MKIYIAIPCMETMPVDFVVSLERLRRIDTTTVNFLSGSLVYDARDRLAANAVMLNYDYILWLDSDMAFGSDLLTRLMKDIDEGKDFVTGLYYRRRAPFTPVVYTKIDPFEELDEIPDEMFEVDGCGFGCVLMKVSMLKDIIDKEHNCFVPLPGHGEDLSFCIRAKRQGYKLWCDPSLKLGHIGTQIVTEQTYLNRKKG